MSEPVAPISGIYPPPAIIARNDTAGGARNTAPEAVAPVSPVAAARLGGVHGAVLAGNGWVPVLHTSQRRGLRADETERRRYRANYTLAASSPAPAVPRMERRA